VVRCDFSALCMHVFARIRHLDIILTPSATLVRNFVSVAPSVAELACGEIWCTPSVTQSLNQSITHSPGNLSGTTTESKYTTVLHNTAQNSSDNLPSYPPDNHHSSDAVYWRWREHYVLKTWQTVQNVVVYSHILQPSNLHSPCFMSRVLSFNFCSR